MLYMCDLEQFGCNGMKVYSLTMLLCNNDGLWIILYDDIMCWLVDLCPSA